LRRSAPAPHERGTRRSHGLLTPGRAGAISSVASAPAYTGPRWSPRRLLAGSGPVCRPRNRPGRARRRRRARLAAVRGAGSRSTSRSSSSRRRIWTRLRLLRRPSARSSRPVTCSAASPREWSPGWLLTARACRAGCPPWASSRARITTRSASPELVAPDGSVIGAGIDLGALAPDGRLRRIVSFADPLPKEAETTGSFATGVATVNPRPWSKHQMVASGLRRGPTSSYAVAHSVVRAPRRQQRPDEG
jgi:hypothetical protein